MADLILNPIASINNVSLINDNFKKIQDSVNGDVVHKVGGKNVLDQDLDLNGNDLINIAYNPSNPNGLVPTYALVAETDARVAGDTVEASTRLAKDNDLQSQIDLLEVGVASGTIGYDTKALMDADLSRPAGAIALVTNDPTPINNTTYKKSGGPGTGSWVVTFDRVDTAVAVVTDELDAATAAATQAAAEAQAAATAAGISADIYATTAAGLAATNATTNKYFSVPSAGANDYLDLYLNNAGSAVFQKTYPSSALVSAMASGDFTAQSNFKFVQMVVESGYAWALVDSVGRAAMMVAPDGTASIPKYDKAANIAQNLLFETGYAWAVADTAGRVALGIKPDGSVVGKFVVPEIPGEKYLRPTQNIWCLGDSLTAGAYSQVTWREKIAADYPTRAVTNWAVGGQTSTQIAARSGAYVSLVTVSGNQIPASGPVSVTGLSILLQSTAAITSGTTTITGWISGIYGTMACAHDATNINNDVYTFTRSAAGTATYCMPNSPFVPDVADHDLDTFVVFLGRNNLTAPNDIQRDIAACVGFQKTAEKRFLVITPPNGGPITPGVHTDEGTGSNTLASVKQIETWATQLYGDRVLASRPFSWQFNNGSADDLDDVALETVPRSLRLDQVHWTTAFHTQVGLWVENEINRRGW